MRPAVSDIELRAFRGTRKSAVYRDHTLHRAAFERIVAAARDAHLSTLAELDPSDTRELDKRAARRLAEEVTRLRTSAALLELDDDLTEIAAVANWCARANERSWLLIHPF